MAQQKTITGADIPALIELAAMAYRNHCRINDLRYIEPEYETTVITAQQVILKYSGGNLAVYDIYTGQILE